MSIQQVVVPIGNSIAWTVFQARMHSLDVRRRTSRRSCRGPSKFWFHRELGSLAWRWSEPSSFTVFRGGQGSPLLPRGWPPACCRLLPSLSSLAENLTRNPNVLGSTQFTYALSWVEVTQSTKEWWRNVTRQEKKGVLKQALAERSTPSLPSWVWNISSTSRFPRKLFPCRRLWASDQIAPPFYPDALSDALSCSSQHNRR